MDEYINNYVDRFYGNYLNKLIYIQYDINNIECCKFISHKSYINFNDKIARYLLLIQRW